jgi:glycosyltransferase involved in cell wall biosynthesis
VAAQRQRRLSNRSGPAVGPATRPASEPWVAAVVPVYNEEQTLAAVLAALQETSGIDEVLVVSDGSTDGTAAVARAMGVTTVELRRNHGKGLAMAAGVAHTAAPVILFVDGDIAGLEPAVLRALIAPVVRGELAMHIGVRHRGPLVNAFHRRFGPQLSGIRCLRRDVFTRVPARYLRGYRVETALNWVCRRLGLPVGILLLHHLEHIKKEAKRGFLAGAGQRLAMFAAVFSAWLRLKITDPMPGPVPGAAARRGPALSPEPGPPES